MIIVSVVAVLVSTVLVRCVRCLLTGAIWKWWAECRSRCMLRRCLSVLMRCDRCEAGMFSVWVVVVQLLRWIMVVHRCRLLSEILSCLTVLTLVMTYVNSVGPLVTGAARSACLLLMEVLITNTSYSDLSVSGGYSVSCESICVTADVSASYYL